MFATLEQAFIKVHGQNAINHLRNIVNNTTILTIGGDQLTGKTTLCKDISKKLNVPFISSGVVFRELAKEKGLTVAQLSQQAHEDPSIDTAIEYATCETILRGPVRTSQTDLVLIEGRNPSVMAKFCKDVIGKPENQVISIYLSCSARVQARRFIGREINRELAFAIDALLPAGHQYSTLHDVALDIRNVINHPTIKTICEDSNIPIETVLDRFIDNEGRDEFDRKRYLSLYGFPPELDYRHPSLYDLIVDTTQHSPSDSLELVLKYLSEHSVGKSIVNKSHIEPKL